MWPWRKAETAAPTPPPVTSHDDVVRAPRADWQLVGPIQRVISEPPLINPVQRFSGSLAAWQDPSFLAPLAHVVAADEPSGLIPQIVRPVAATDLPLATPPAPSASTRPVQRVASIASPASAGPTSSTVETSGGFADQTPISVLRSAPVVQRAHDSGPAGRIETPTALTLHAVPAPVSPRASTVQRHTDHAGHDQPEPDAGTVAQRATDAITVSRHAYEAPADVAQTSPDAAYAQLISADAPSALPLAQSTTQSAAGSTSAAPTSTADLPVTSASQAPRRLGLGEPLVGGSPVQRATAPPPSPMSTPLPFAATLPAGATEIRVPPPLSPSLSPSAEPVEVPTLGAPASSPLPESRPRTEVVTVGSGRLPLLPAVQRALDPSSLSTGSGAPATNGYTTAHADHGSATAPSAGQAPPLTLVGLVGSNPPLISPPTADTAAHHVTPSGSPVPAVQRLAAGSAPATRTTAQLISEARNPPDLTYAAPDAPARRTATAQPAGTYLSSLPIATASWVNPSIQRSEAAPSMAPMTVSRAVDVAEMTVETPAGNDPASAAGAAPTAAGGAGGGDPTAMVEHLFDPLLARLKTELRLDRERRGSLTDLWH